MQPELQYAGILALPLLRALRAKEMAREYPIDLLASITAGNMNVSIQELQDVCDYLSIPFKLHLNKEYLYEEIKVAIEVQNRTLTKVVCALAQLSEVGHIEFQSSEDTIKKINFEFSDGCSRFMAGIIKRSL